MNLFEDRVFGEGIVSSFTYVRELLTFWCEF